MFRLPSTQEDIWATWLLMQEVPGVGPGRLKTLHDKTGNITGILDLIFKTCTEQESPPKWILNLKNALENQDLSKYYNIIKHTYDVGAKICTLDDPNYPPNLKQSRSAPSILFYKGALHDISQRALALVGTVTPSELGVKRAQKFAGLCVKNEIQVISGLARGIDTASHKAALKYGGKTYAVIGHGIDYCYPAENKELFNEITKNGAVISQFPTGTKPQKWMFPARNEIMCTLSSGTVIIEAHEGCGSVVQAKYSFKHKRKVFILNSNLQNNHGWAYELVNTGAQVVKEFNTVLKEMGDFKSNKNKENNYIQKTLKLEDDNKAILFDLDGVLFDAQTVMENAYVESFKQMNKEVDLNLLREYINNSPPYIFKTFGCDPKKGNQLYKKEYLKALDEFYQPIFDGIEKAILKLKNKNHKIGIVTSQPKNRYKAIITKTGVKDLIDVVITWNDLPRDKQKPHPEGILKALSALNVNPSRAAYIGDGKKDILAAQNAYVKAIAVSWGLECSNELLKLKPDKILDNPTEIGELDM